MSSQNSTWAARLAAPDLRESDFAELVLEAIASRVAVEHLERLGPLELALVARDGTRSRLFLENVWRQVSGSPPSQRARFVEAYLRTLDRIASDTPPERSSIVATVKDAALFEGVRRTSGVEDATGGLAARPLVADLWTVYAYDLPGAIQLMTEEERVAARLPYEHLEAIALDNLRRMLPELTFRGNGRGFLVSAGGNYEASLLLLPELWERLSAQVAGELVACVPARDVLLYTGTGITGGVESVREVAAKTLEGGDHAISATLLRWTRGEWRKLD